jgi:hypothetical protein
MALGQAENKMYDYATGTMIDTRLSSSATIFHNIFTFLPAIVLFVAIIWLWTVTQKKEMYQ